MKQIRTPKQQRSIETKEKIIKAAFALFADKGIHGTNTKEIAKAAKVSIGSFYSYFENKKTLLLDMLEDYLDEHFSTVWRSLDHADVSALGYEGLRVIIDNVFKAYDISPEFHRQTHSLRYTDPQIMRLYDRERKRELDQIQYLIEKNSHRLPHIRDPYAAAMVIHNAVENVAHTAKFTTALMDEERLAESLTQMISSYFLGNEGGQKVRSKSESA